MASSRQDAGEHDLAREARLLESARVLLSTDAVSALVLLGRHEKEFPNGGLEIERQLLTVDALVRLGRKSEAEARARTLRGRAPGNLYEQRLERLLGEAR